MPTVVFMHGTGVRQPRYAQNLAEVTQVVAEVRPGTPVRGCYWGERFGARLSAAGASIPDVTRSRAATADNLPAADDLENDDVDAWSVLFLDPIAELRTSTGSDPPGLQPPGRETRAEVLGDRARAGLSDPQIMAAAERAGIARTLTRAMTTVLGNPEVSAALNDADLSEAGPYLLARAIVAEAVSRLGDPGADPPTLDGSARDALVAALARHLDPQADSRALPAAVTEAVARTARLAWRLYGSRVLERRRAAILSSAHPMPGDVLVYLARGGDIRALIADQIRAADPPTVLIGHSLGGVACVDLLVEHPQLPVAKLITVGSQAPLLYELGALPSLQPPVALPTSFPEWVNVYDPRDLLAFVGNPVFPGRVRDVPVDSRQPFPYAHSAYWSLTAFRDLLDAELPADSVPLVEVR
jgi:hypothetical protein